MTSSRDTIYPAFYTLSEIWSFFIMPALMLREKACNARAHLSRRPHPNAAPRAFWEHPSRMGEYVEHHRRCEKCLRTKWYPSGPNFDRDLLCHWGKVLLNRWEQRQ